ncbi:uncharacterized protein BJ171DRAFT_61584 [Polychytrium aggregatum]|uniref:uncharacterized protein n=1 Tax=Polychytrium aggregatum TaxID=110093 RepID=UPI0022FDF4CB|nr:uncharacterized protein BJ171DRAFT_61584 [Polychytrium aggregatum]KAI9205472.1 hypothetical protein BJ171DRAFT_61584 [Polychytrium aggregatum]
MCLIFTQIPALARIQSLRYLGSGVLITAVFVSSSAFGFVFHRNLKKIEDQMKEISRRRSSSDATSIVLLWLKMVIISIMLMSFFCIVVYFALLGLYLGGILDFDGFLQATTAIQLAGVPLYFGGCLGFLETIYISVENLFCYGDGAVPTIKSTYGLTTTKHATTVIQSQVAEKPEHNSADSGLIP